MSAARILQLAVTQIAAIIAAISIPEIESITSGADPDINAAVELQASSKSLW